MNGWQHAKGGPTTLGFLTRDDIPFYYALADAYTIGDAYHCSVLAATGPNRTYLWSGTINAGQRHGDFVANAAADYLGDFLPWECYPVTLQQAGLSWKIYQGSDNYGDNGAQYFATFAELDPAQGGTAPAPGANVYYDQGLAVVAEPLDYQERNGDNLANAIEADVRAGTLPQVSWVVTNQRYSEHPNGAPADGAYYVGRVLQALNADPDVLNSTVVIVNYDENDGQFDHVPPPTPPAGTADEFCLDRRRSPRPPVPVGLGFRVPLLLISPWTRGGWVTSEVCDHTSVLQFLEQWTTAIGRPARCPHISDWRRSSAVTCWPRSTSSTRSTGCPTCRSWPPRSATRTSTTRCPPADVMPAQEPGAKPARPLPYQPNANLTGFTASGSHGHRRPGAEQQRPARPEGEPLLRPRQHAGRPRPRWRTSPAGSPGSTRSRRPARRGEASPAVGPVERGRRVRHHRGRTQPVPPAVHRQRHRGGRGRAGDGGLLRQGLGPAPDAHADPCQRRLVRSDVHRDAEPLLRRPRQAPGRRRPAGRLPARPADDGGRLVRPDGRPSTATTPGRSGYTGHLENGRPSITGCGSGCGVGGERALTW